MTFGDKLLRRIENHEQFVACFMAVAGIEEMLERNGSLECRDDEDLLFLRPPNPISEFKRVGHGRAQ